MVQKYINDFKLFKKLYGFTTQETLNFLEEQKSVIYDEATELDMFAFEDFIKIFRD